MGLKKEKYAYIELSPDNFVKVRVIKSKAEDSPRKYQVVSRATARAPAKARVIKLDSLPEPARKSVIEQLTR